MLLLNMVVTTENEIWALGEISKLFKCLTYLQASHYKLAVLCLNFSPDGVAISRAKRYRQSWLQYLVQEADVGPPESKINDHPFELDAQRYDHEMCIHKTANS